MHEAKLPGAVHIVAYNLGCLRRPMQVLGRAQGTLTKGLICLHLPEAIKALKKQVFCLQQSCYLDFGQESTAPAKTMQIHYAVLDGNAEVDPCLWSFSALLVAQGPLP